ncbi:MAG TPA: ATP-binding protein [Candidatus Acidoferrales bacterium]|jgi:signal transduction histidine kinase|nr:ATP-binding protein [Candidatus Acidoferrales bacterium]
MAHNWPVLKADPSRESPAAAASEAGPKQAEATALLDQNDRHQHAPKWFDVLLLLFVAGLAALPPIREYHKQLILAAIVIVQLFESRIVAWSPQRGPAYSVLLKIVLATILLDHTGAHAGDLGINSSYWPIYLLPVVTAATYFGPWGTLLWTTLASAAYCSYLIPASQEYLITTESVGELAGRVLFFFLAAMFVNRFAVEIRRRAAAYQVLAEQMVETNRRLAQAQEEARRSERLAALGQMSAGLAHEIRNPLGVIRGSAEMLNQKLQLANPLASELAGYILSETNRLSELVARFLDFARPMSLELVPGNLAEVSDRALEAASAQRPDAKIRVERVYAPGLPAVPMDERLCEQVFINLALNAYDAMEAKGGTLRVEIARAQRAGIEGAEVTFRDTGPGIPPELSQQIFNPFFTTKKTGVGLGLAIVSKIVDEHHGSLRVESEPGQGASFRVFFPAAVPAAPSAGARPAHSHS